MRTVRLRFLPLLAAILLAGCSSLGGAPLGEVGELATMGSTRPLREPLRPIRGETRVLVLALDGVGADELEEAIEEGRLPTLAALLGPERGAEGVHAHGYAVPGVLSVLPSATTPAWASVFTGAPPARTGIPGNEWFVREERRFYAPVPVSVSRRSHAVRLFTDELLSDLLQAPTVYERLGVRSHVSLHPVFRGADLLTLPNVGTLGDLFGEIAEGVVAGGGAQSPDVFRETDESSIRSIARAVEDSGLPDLQVAYFPGIDLFTHQAEDPLASQQRYLAEVVDPAVAQLLELYRERGALDDLWVVVVADHGHTPVLPTDRNSLGVDGDDEPAAVLRGAGYRVRAPALGSDQGRYQAVLAYQGAMAYVYLADRGTCPAEGDACDWSRPPRLEQDVLPAARAFWEASRTGARVPALRGTLDLVLARGTGPAGEARPFQVFDGERLVPVDEYLRRNPRPDLLALRPRLEALAVGPYGNRAGDLLLLARSGMDAPIGERFYFSGPERSEHGSAHAQDSRVPLLVARPGGSGAEVRERVRAAVGTNPTQLDVAPLLEALLGR